MSFLLGVACLVCCALAGDFSTVPGTGFFVDGDGVQRLFRGVNLVRKEPGAWQVTHEELNVMQKLGLNVVRYGVIWSNVEEAPGVYNDTYLKEVRGQIELLYSHGIYSFLEMHQDLLSPFFCAGQDGSPIFYNMPPHSSEYLKGGSKAYPMPFAKPEYIEGPSAEAYGPWGQPKCGRLSQWGESYATYASCSTWQAFYDNVDGVQDKFAAAWSAVASAVAQDNPGVMGIEILNEPWVGDIYADPLLLVGGKADRQNLVPLYDRVQKALREVVPEVPIMFEPITGGSIMDREVGFTQDTAPGGPAMKRKNVFTFHLYCPLIQSDVPLPSSGKLIKRIELAVCNKFDQLNLDTRGRQSQMLAAGSFLSEYGSIPATSEATNMMSRLLSVADSNMMSWTFWEMGMLKRAPDWIQNSLDRSYPAVVPGRVVRFKTEMNITVAGTTLNSFHVEFVASDSREAKIQLARSAFPLSSRRVSFKIVPESATFRLNSTSNAIFIASAPTTTVVMEAVYQHEEVNYLKHLNAIQI